MVPPPARLAVAGKQLTGMPGRYANGGDSANGGGSEEGEKAVVIMKRKGTRRGREVPPTAPDVVQLYNLNMKF